ncbi:zinc finger protein 345-like isoform X2 [Bacillus rossius redtenbacheri]
MELASKINSLLPITVGSGDHLPKQVCVSCVTKLNTCKDLFETCMRTDEHLRYLARKKLFRSSPCTDVCPLNSKQNHKNKTDDCVDRSRGSPEIHLNCDQPELDTSGSYDSDAKQGNCNLFNMASVSDSYVCPFNCGGAMVVKSVLLDSGNREDGLSKDLNTSSKNSGNHADEDANGLGPQNVSAVREISSNVVYELTDSAGQKYAIPEWCQAGTNIDNLEIIIHTLNPNFELADEDCPTATQEVKEEVRDNACQVCNETFPNSELLAEHSKGHRDSASLCTLCMVRFQSPAELASHMAGHRGNHKKMVKIANSRRFGCSVCLRKFNNEKTWRRHSCSPSEHKLLRCSICSKVFHTEERLAFHKKLHNGAEKNYCEKCSKHFDTESLLYAHCSFAHKEDKPYACGFCKERFFSAAGLVVHECVRGADSCLECGECRRRFRSREALTRHRATHGPVRGLQCELCGLLCERKGALRRHVLAHHRPPDHSKRGHSLIHYRCKPCGKTFTGSRDVLAHESTHRGVDADGSTSPPLVCGFCTERFPDPRVLARHRRESHRDEKPYVCSVCELCFRTLHEARRHRRTHAEAGGGLGAAPGDTAAENTLVCEACGAQLSGGWKLRAHMKLHRREPGGRSAGGKPFPCGQCGKSFSQGSALHVHALLHTGEKPHPCDLCGATFRIKADRDNHRRTHTGEKPYRCEYCSKEFRTGQVYYQHRMIHTGERRFPCDVCGKAFKRSHTLVVHKRIHTGEKPNVCDVCGKGFRQRTDMRKHRALHARR